MADGYEILSIDDLDRHEGPTADAPVLLPLRRRLGFRPFGLNCWTAPAVGKHVIESHSEIDGDEELYVVLRGRATFTVAGQAIEGPVCTLVHVAPGTPREAIAAEEGTIILAAGAKPGRVFEPAPWEDFAVAFSLRRSGERDEGRTLVEETLARHPGEWQGPYNAACFEALDGETDQAFDYLRRALDLEPKVREYALEDPDFALIASDPRWNELLG